MKRWLLVTALLFSAGNAVAQAPQEVIPEGEIWLAVGQIKIFRFEETIGRVNVVTQGQVEATPQSDRQISLVGVAAGSTQMFVFNPDGKRLYGATVNVTSEPGRIVKMYGTGKNNDLYNPGFTAMSCNEFGCARPDKDLPVPQISIERISRDRR